MGRVAFDVVEERDRPRDGEWPWYLVDNTTKVFANKDALATLPLGTIEMSEQGRRVTTDRFVWTGTATGGRVGETCSDWANSSEHATVGESSDANQWTDAFESNNFTCYSALRLYCFEVR